MLKMKKICSNAAKNQLSSVLLLQLACKTFSKHSVFTRLFVAVVFINLSLFKGGVYLRAAFNFKFNKSIEFMGNE